MPHDAPQPDQPKPRAKMIDVTNSPEAKALVITGQSAPPKDEPPKNGRFLKRNVTGTREGGDLQIIGVEPPEPPPTEPPAG